MGAITGLEIFSAEGGAVTALLALRLTGVLWVAPVWSARVITMQAKGAILVLLVAVLWPSAMVSGAGADFGVPTVLNELLIGITLGLGAAIFVAAAESAGDMLAVQMGLSGANVLNPMSATQLPILGQFLGLFVTALILSTGGHVVIIRALAASLDLLPVGGPINFEDGIRGAVGLGSQLLWMGLRTAGPVVAAMMIGNSALGVLARTVPQLNVLMVAFPVQIAIGLFVLGGTLPLIATQFVDWSDAYQEITGGLLRALVPVEGVR